MEVGWLCCTGEPPLIQTECYTYIFILSPDGSASSNRIVKLYPMHVHSRIRLTLAAILLLSILRSFDPGRICYARLVSLCTAHNTGHLLRGTP
jgi:hypothetical protein